MGKVTRKRYSAEFKAKVALEAMKGESVLGLRWMGMFGRQPVVECE